MYSSILPSYDFKKDKMTGKTDTGGTVNGDSAANNEKLRAIFRGEIF